MENGRGCTSTGNSGTDGNGIEIGLIKGVMEE